MDGIPTKETLQELDLAYVSEDLIKRGILTEEQSSPSKKTSVETDKK